MKGSAYLKCIDPKCALEYPIDTTIVECERGHLLDVQYKESPSPDLKKLFLERRNPSGNIFNESGVWRFRELINFCQIDTNNYEECAKYLVSLDGAEGRQSKPYHMAKPANFVGLPKEEIAIEFPNGWG